MPSALRRPVAKRSAAEKNLPRFIGVEAPDAGAGFEFDAGIYPGRFLGTVVLLAGVRRGAEIDEDIAFGIDRKWA